MNFDRSQPLASDPSQDATARKLADAEHLRGLAKSYATFLQVASKEDCTAPHAAELQRSTYEDLCQTLAEARRLTGNREPELAEVLAELQRLEEEYRELLG